MDLSLRVAEGHHYEGQVGPQQLQHRDHSGGDDGALPLARVVPKLAEHLVQLQDGPQQQEERQPREDQLDRLG